MQTNLGYIIHSWIMQIVYVHLWYRARQQCTKCWQTSTSSPVYQRLWTLILTLSGLALMIQVSERISLKKTNEHHTFWNTPITELLEMQGMNYALSAFPKQSLQGTNSSNDAIKFILLLNAVWRCLYHSNTCLPPETTITFQPMRAQYRLLSISVN